MHIPDGFLGIRTATASGALALTGVAVAVRQVRIHLPSRKVPLLGLAAAFIFVAQMLNFPVVGGTSGHLIGAVLAAILLGPASAVVVMTSVLILQCLFFADGGLFALGANIFNMAILAPCVGSAVYAPIRRLIPGLRGQLVATAFGSWCSVVVAAISCAGQLALSGTVPWLIAFPAVTTIHMLIGFGEAVMTALVVAAIARTRPELLHGVASRGGISRSAMAYGLISAVGLAVFVAPFASPWPDGLERVAKTLGFDKLAASSPPHSAPFPDYHLPGIPSTVAGTALAGAGGTAIAFLFAFALARALTPRSRPSLRAEDPV